MFERIGEGAGNDAVAAAEIDNEFSRMSVVGKDSLKEEGRVVWTESAICGVGEG
jgi:hypothetical protein